MLNKLLLAFCAGLIFAPAVSLAATAAPSTTAPGVPPAVDKIVRDAVHSFAKGVQIESVAPSPLPEFYQVIASGQLVYVTADGKYMMNGDLVNVASHTSLNDAAWAKLRMQLLASVPDSQRIIYAPPGKPKATLTVFTDVNCGFCRALHEHMADFNKAGIKVEYLAWPREGLVGEDGKPTKTYTEMVSVWCAKDRKAAFDQAKKGIAPPQLTCTNPVKSQFELGRRLGVNGTPAIIGPDGNLLGGYLTPAQVLVALKQGIGD